MHRLLLSIVHGLPAHRALAFLLLAGPLFLVSERALSLTEAECIAAHECVNRIPDRDPEDLRFKDRVDADGYLYGPCAWHKWSGCFNAGAYASGPDVGAVLTEYEANIEANPNCGCDVWFERTEDWLAGGASEKTTCGTFPSTSSGIETGNRQWYRIYEQCDATPQTAHKGWFLFERQRLTTCPPGSTPGKVPGTGVSTCLVTDEAPLLNTGACPTKGSGRAGAPMSPIVANPVNAATGNKYQREVDYISPVTAGLRLERHYNSEPAVRAGVLGRQWRHTYERSVERVLSSAGVWREDGRALFFTRTADGTWRSRTGTIATLTELADGAGAPSGWEYRPGNDRVERYDADGRLLAITTRGGFTQTLEYDEAGQLGSVTGPFGRRLVFEHAEGRLVTVHDPAGGAIRYGHSGDRLTLVAYPDATPADLDDDPTRQYHYEDAAFPRHLTGISDERGVRIATWSYDSQGRAVTSTHAGGANANTITYNADGTTTVDDALGHRRDLTFELNHGIWRLKESTGGRCASCAGGIHSTEVDDNGFLARSVSYNGHVTEYAHDTRGLEVSRTEAAGTPLERTTTTEWHAGYRVPVRIEEPGKVITFTYDPAGRLLTRTETDPATGRTRTVSHGYNEQGLLVVVDGPRTDVDDSTHLEYIDGVVTRISNALGHETRITAHDAHGRPTRVVNPNGLVTELAYDARGRLTMRSIDGRATWFEYDPAGQLISTTLPDSSTLEYRYDEAGRLVSAADAVGNRIDYELDPMGHRTAEHRSGPDGTLAVTHRQVFDALGQLVRSVDGEGHVRGFEYDAMGNLTATLDGKGPRSDYHYDALERQVQSIDPLGGITGFSYDARDNLVSVTDPRSLVTAYTVDGLDDRLGEASPDRGSRTYQSDAAGNRVSETDGRGVTAVLTYDALNRLTAVRFPNAGQVITYTYDAAPNGIGRLASVADESGTTHYEYDIRGNLVVERRTIAGTEFLTRYAYDAVDRVAAMTWPSGRVATYTRDTAGRVTAIDLTDGGGVSPLASDIDYDGAGRPVAWTLGNGIDVQQRYDLAGRAQALDTPGVLERVYGYDENDNVQSIQDLLLPEASQTFGYDALDRLSAANGRYGNLGYEYDATGNRTSQSDGPTTELYRTAPDSNRLLEVLGPDGASFHYDDAGNLVERGRRTYDYGDTGRLQATHLDGEEQARYRYNAAGERSVRDTTSGRTRYVFDGAGRMIAEVDDTGAIDREYVYLGDRPLALLQRGHATTQPQVFVSTGLDARSGTQVETRLDLGARTLEVRENGELTLSESDMTIHLDTPAPGMLRATKVLPHHGLLRLQHASDPQGAESHPGSLLLIRQPDGPNHGFFRFNRVDADGRYHGVSDSMQPVEAVLDEESKRFTIFHPDGTVRLDVNLSTAAWWQRTYYGRQFRRAWETTAERRVWFYSMTRPGKPGNARAYLMLRQDSVNARSYPRLSTTVPPTPPASTDSVRYYHTDHLGTPQALTDEAGQMVWRGDYLPFGEVLEGVADSEQPMRYPGQHEDGEAGGYYNYQRYYDPSTGRYLTSDPIGLDGGINTYMYARGNPLRFTDPTGENPLAALRAGILAGEGINALVVGITGAATIGTLLFDALSSSSSEGVITGAVGTIDGVGRAANDDSCAYPADRDCEVERVRLEANKDAIKQIGTSFRNPLKAAREYNKAARQFNETVNIHNAVCPFHRVEHLPLK